MLRATIATGTFNPGAEFEPQDGKHSDASFVSHQWVNSLCGKAASCLESVVWKTSVRKSGNTLVGELAAPDMTVEGIRCGRVVSVGDYETGCPGFDLQSRYYGHGGVSLGKAHFLA